MRQQNSGAAPDLMASDLILPSQFFELVGKSRFSSEQRLMLAVLADAINILLDWRGSFSIRKRRLFVEAARWVMTHSTNVPFSFDNVCDALEINAESLRQRLSGLAAGTGDPQIPLARLRLKEAGRLQHMTVNRRRRAKRHHAMRAGQA
jgi:hypothetical protein